MTLKICRVLDLYEKFHRENIGRNDVENRRFSAFFYTLTQNSATGGHLGPVMFIVATSGAQRLSIRIEMGAWNPHSGICQSFICEKSHICEKKFGGTLGKLAVVSLQIRIFARRFHRWIGIWSRRPSVRTLRERLSTLDLVFIHQRRAHTKFWPILTDPTRVRARKKHSPTAFSRLCCTWFDAELDALSSLKICRVMDL